MKKSRSNPSLNLLSVSALAIGMCALPSSLHAAENDEIAENADDAQQTSTQNGTQAAPTEKTRNSDDFHIDEAIVVTAPFFEELNILAGTSSLSGDRLTNELRPQIGDILTKLPGVSATSFAPGASRPVLRGLQGPRVLVLNDGLGTIDVSVTSPDHGVTVEPLLLDRVEVLRGAAVLLFGGGAIGGAVNTIDKRIPRAVPDEDFHLDILSTYATAANEFGLSGSLDVPLTPNFVAHIDGSYRNSGNLSVGGDILTPELQAQQIALAADAAAAGEAEEAAEILEFAETNGFIPNTQTETYNIGGGFNFFGNGFTFGASVGYLNSDYGVPNNPNVSEEEEEEEGGEEGGEEEGEGVTIALDQIKIDLRSEIDLSGGFEKIRIRAAYADFQQTEFEAPGEPGTVFDNQGVEARIELVQSENNGWRGASGVQYSYRDFSAIGAEAFVPPNVTNQYGIFTLQEVTTGKVDLEGALRLDFVDSASEAIGVDRSFTSFSAAAGLGYNLIENVKLGINLTRAERAPSPEELFSNGPHLATATFEIGNPDFDTETSYGGELYVRIEQPGWQLSVAGYVNSINDFIIELPTGGTEDGLPIFQFIQNDADFLGFEVQGSADIGQAGDFGFTIDGVADYVNADLDGLGPVPRIPPLRLLGGLEAQSDSLNLRAEVEWFDDQERNAAFETETDGFTLVNLSAAWKPLGDEAGITLIASANNLFDVVGRRAASFTKDFAPLAGRDFRISAKLSF